MLAKQTVVKTVPMPIVAEVTTNKGSYFNSVNGFQRMLDKTAIIHFTLIHLHVTLGRNQCPTVGNVTSRHVRVAYVLTDNSVYLTNSSALTLLSAITATANVLCICYTSVNCHRQFCSGCLVSGRCGIMALPIAITATEAVH